MTRTRSAAVMGVDACPGGWIGLVLTEAGVRAHAAARIADLAALAGEPLDVIAIDIPIGLPDRGRRSADVLARAAVGPHRAATVFLAPVRDALLAADHATAVRINRELAGEGVSVQSYRLRERILEVDSWVRLGTYRCVEVHPEASFAAMAGAPLRTAKTTWAGFVARKALLAAHGITLPEPRGIGDTGSAAVDDVLDAAAAAWSALRVASGTARRLPDPPETFTDGWPSAIWT